MLLICLPAMRGEHIGCAFAGLTPLAGKDYMQGTSGKRKPAMNKHRNIFQRAYDAVIESRTRRAKLEIEMYRELYERADRD